MKYDHAFHRQIELADGATITLRAIAPQDKAALSAGHDRLSERSRRARFFFAKKKLTEAELRFFTEVDGVRHYALVAASETDGLPPAGVGVARFVCTDDPQVAEVAIVVADEWQNRGLGKLLMHAIVEAAAERDVAYIKAITQAANTNIHKLLAPYGGSVRMLEGSGGLLEVMMDVPRPATAERLDSFCGLIRLAALGALGNLMGIGSAAAAPDVAATKQQPESTCKSVAP